MDLKWMFQKNAAGKTGLGLTFEIAADECKNNTEKLFKFAKKKTMECLLVGAMMGTILPYMHNALNIAEKVPEVEKALVQAYNETNIIRNAAIGAVGYILGMTLLGGGLLLKLSGRAAHKEHKADSSYAPKI